MRHGFLVLAFAIVFHALFEEEVAPQAAFHAGFIVLAFWATVELIARN